MQSTMTSTDQYKEEIDALLDGVEAVCSANSFEHLSIWKEYTTERDEKNWVSNNVGLIFEIATIGDRPTVLSMFTATIEGRKFLFYDGTSMLVDHAAIDNWLNANLPGSAFRKDGYKNHSDAMNFFNLL